MQIPFFDYSIVNSKFKINILKEINSVLNLTDNDQHNSYVKEFEENFANYIGTKHAIGVDSGTTALQLSLTALGLKPGDGVIIPAYGYIATALAVSNIDAIPVFSEIKEDLTIDPEKIKKNITEKTKAIIPVHIHGNPCQMDIIQETCHTYDLKLIEDASQAHGAKFKGKKVGSFGIGCFSLHSSKTLGGLGDAGIITLNDRELYEKIKSLMIPDNNSKSILDSKRTPCNLNPIQAAILKVKLKELGKFNERKNQIAKLYNELLSDDIQKIIPNKDSYPVYRDYCIKIKDREKLMKNLKEKGIETKARYKIPLHLTNTFSYLNNNQNNLQKSIQAANEILCLPSFIGIKDEQIEYISNAINQNES